MAIPQVDNLHIACSQHSRLTLFVRSSLQTRVGIHCQIWSDPFLKGWGVGLSDEQLARWFAYPMHIFAGDQDIVEDDPNLPSQPEALAQGPSRFKRAHFVYAFAMAQAKSVTCLSIGN